jgi:hypothetical protein
MKYYNNGGLTDAGTSTVAEESSLSSWAGPYVTDMLGRGAALANMPYTPYEGPLTAGPSALQQQAFGGLGALSVPSTLTGGTTQQQIAGLMNPYIEQALNPQLEAARRQAEIQAQELQTQYGKAGAYGGSRQGVAEAELQRGLLDRMAQLTGEGYRTAYDKAVDLLGRERGYSLDALAAQRQAGAEQRAIEQAGVAADIAQFEQERDYPYKQTQFMQSLLQSLPLETQTYSYYEPSGLQNVAGGLDTVNTIYDLLKEIATR